MKFIYEFTFLNYKEGERKKGGIWKGISVTDEFGNNFILYGDNASEFKNAKQGELIEVPIEINNITDYKTNEKRLYMKIGE